MNFKEMTGKSIRESFNTFHRRNPHVYKSFEEQSLNAIKAGRTKLSAKLIINWIRWNELLKNTTDKNFKINDAYQSYYPRLFEELHPEHEGIFKKRKLRNEESGPFVKVDDDGQISFY